MMATGISSGFRPEDRQTPGRQQGDDELIAQALGAPDGRQGKEAASRLLARYQDRIYIWCLKHVRNHELALDLAQDVLISAYRNLASFTGKAQFGSWIFSIARNRCLSELRRPSIVLVDGAEIDHIAAREGDPLQQVIDRMGEDALLELISAELEPQEQEALWLRCIDLVPVEMITELLAIEDVSGARAVLQRARRKLRAALARRDTRLGRNGS